MSGDGLDIDAMDRLVEQMRQHREMVVQYEMDRSRREWRASCASAMQSVCSAMACNAMIGSVFIEDPEQAAKSFGDSIKWQMAGIVAALGEPELVVRLLAEDK